MNGAHDLSEKALVIGTTAAFARQADLCWEILQDIEGDMTHYGHILGGMVFAYAAVVLPERHIQTPVQRIFNTPMFTHCPRKCLDIGQRCDIIKEIQQNSAMSDEMLIWEIRTISTNIINAAERFIRIYREYRNGELSEENLIDAVEPIGHEIHTLFMQEENLPYPSLSLREWAVAHEQLASAVSDFSLYYNKRYLDRWSTENRIYLMGASIKKYESALDALRILDDTV